MLSVWLVEILMVFIGTILISYIFRRRQLYVLSWNLSGPLALPILGNALNFLCKDDELYSRAVDICSRYISPVRLWFGPKLKIVVTDVLQAEKIMSSAKFAAKDDIYKFLEPAVGKGLITASGSKWKRDRRLLSPLFLKRNISQYFPCILNHSKILVDILQEKNNEPIFNVEPLIHKCVADFFNETIMGVNTKAQFGEMDTFIEMLKRMYTIIYARILKVWLQSDWIFKLSHYWKEHEDGIQLLHGFVRKALQNAQKEHSHSEEPAFRPLIHHILDIRNSVPNFATDEELVHHLSTLYTASEDTVTSITAFTLVLLGMYLDIQKKVIQEIFNVIGKRNVEENDIAKLEYLDMVLKDVLRLFPIAPFLARQPIEDFHIGHLLIPKGASVIVSIQSIHRDKKHWEKPNEFYPEHFLPEAVRKRHPYAFMPFSAGPRGCIGKPFAYMAMKILLITILQNFEIETEGKLEDKKLKMDISIRFKDEFYPVRIRKRCVHFNKIYI